MSFLFRCRPVCPRFILGTEGGGLPMIHQIVLPMGLTRGRLLFPAALQIPGRRVRVPGVRGRTAHAGTRANPEVSSSDSNHLAKGRTVLLQFNSRVIYDLRR